VTFYGTCDYCFDPVNGKPGTDDGPAFPVTGWEILREEGGANQIHGRERIPGGVRHVKCLPTKVQEEAQGRLL
jgi:hypothetical protein